VERLAKYTGKERNQGYGSSLKKYRKFESAYLEAQKLSSSKL